MKKSLENREIALMYSGGLDTTYVALQLTEEFSKVHLLTFCNGICVRVSASKKHVAVLQEKFGRDKFEYTTIPIVDAFSLFKKNLLKDILKYKSPLLFDLCCRLSMETTTIIYCLIKGIQYASDGSNPNTQGEIFIQQEKYLKVVETFFSRYGIQYVHPYKELKSRKEIRERLQKMVGRKTGITFLETFGITSQLFTQPFCLWSPVPFLFTSGLRRMPFIKYFDLSVEDAICFRLEKEKIVRTFIDNHINPVRCLPRKRSKVLWGLLFWRGKKAI